MSEKISLDSSAKILLIYLHAKFCIWIYHLIDAPNTKIILRFVILGKVVCEDSLTSFDY